MNQRNDIGSDSMMAMTARATCKHCGKRKDIPHDTADLKACTCNRVPIAGAQPNIP